MISETDYVSWSLPPTPARWEPPRQGRGAQALPDPPGHAKLGRSRRVSGPVFRRPLPSPLLSVYLNWFAGKALSLFRAFSDRRKGFHPPVRFRCDVSSTHALQGVATSPSADVIAFEASLPPAAYAWPAALLPAGLVLRWPLASPLPASPLVSISRPSDRPSVVVRTRPDATSSGRPVLTIDATPRRCTAIPAISVITRLLRLDHPTLYRPRLRGRREA
jgi:hypothetical protein